MTKVTIPKTLSNHKDLVAVPRKTYDAFLRWQKKAKSLKTFTPTKTEKKALARGRKNFTKGNYTVLENL